MGPYKIWFGDYEGKFVEELILTVEGLTYLLSLKNPERLVNRVREVMRRSEKLEHKYKCSCGATARYIKYYSDRSGYTFQEVYCEKCKPDDFGKERYVRLSLGGVMAVGGNARKELMGRLRKMWNVPVYCSASCAHALFFPDEVEEIAAREKAAIAKPQQLKLL
ncbi:MAG: hypothetical protein V1928_02160 [Parcubacteria group bacterium]